MNDLFRRAVERFDAENAKDPHRESENGKDHPREWLYARRLTEWALRLEPQASEALQLAARCQHLCRWMIPRNSYEMTRAGYLRWRNDLKQFHAKKAGEILFEVGYPPPMVTRVQDLNLKKHFPKDPESRVLEDALCLVFLQYQFAEFVSKNEEAKVIEVLQKTWKKMTPSAQQAALALPWEPRAQNLVERALIDDRIL